MATRSSPFFKDFSLSAATAGFVVVLIGISSSAVLVFQAARSFGLDAQAASSWLGALCVGMGFLSIVLSLRYRIPVMIAWSTPAAALLAGVSGIALSDALGAFVFSGALIFLSGVTGIFERLMGRIPLSVTAALLAGVLVRFCLEGAVAFHSQPAVVGTMALVYLVSRRYRSRFTMLWVLISGIVTAFGLGLLHPEQVHLAVAAFHWQRPTFSPAVLLSLGVPIFMVTMASQNLTGLSVMRANGYQPKVSSLMSWSGLMNLVTAPFGGFAINLAAITAAIGMSSDVHAEPAKRYWSAVVSGVIYLVIGIFAATVTSVFGAFPAEMIAGLTGLALLPTVAGGLQAALMVEREREAAFLTFVVAASGLSLFGIGSAFWAIVAGTLARLAISQNFDASRA